MLCSHGHHAIVSSRSVDGLILDGGLVRQMEADGARGDEEGLVMHLMVVGRRTRGLRRENERCGPPGGCLNRISMLVHFLGSGRILRSSSAGDEWTWK